MGHPATEAKRRIPDKYRGIYSFFSDWDLWHYEVRMEPTPLGNIACPECMQYEDTTYLGSKLRLLFPYLEILTQQEIHPHVHNHCRCRLWWTTGWQGKHAQRTH